MGNAFEKAYQKEQQAIAAFDAATNDEEKEEARKLHNETFGQIGNMGEWQSQLKPFRNRLGPSSA